MSRRPARFTEADLNRALKAAGRCGYPTMVEILPDSTIRIVPVDKPVEVGGNHQIELAEPEHFKL